jgi:hypothetical protein
MKAWYSIYNSKKNEKLPGPDNRDAPQDVDGKSHHGIPQPTTPVDYHTFPVVKTTDGLKRRSEALGLWLDKEERSGTHAKWQRITMPINGRNKSPVKAVHDLLPFSNGNLENPPPLPRNEPPSTLPVNGVELASIRLSPLPRDNTQSGTAREKGGPAVVSGGHFQVINAASSMALDDTPIMERRPPQDGSGPSARKVSQVPPSRGDDTHASSSYHNTYFAAAAATKHSPGSALAPPTATTAQVPLPAGLSKIFKGTGHTNYPTNKSAHYAPICQRQQEYHLLPPLTHDQARSQQVHHPRESSSGNKCSLRHVLQDEETHSTDGIRTTHARDAPGRVAVALAVTATQAPTIKSAQKYGIHPPQQQQQQQHQQEQHQQEQHQQEQHQQPATPKPSPTCDKARHLLLRDSDAVAASSTIPRAATGDFRTLQRDITGKIIQLFFHKPNHPPDEIALLGSIKTFWHDGEPIFRPELSPNYDLTSDILNTWLKERRLAADIQHATHPSHRLSSSATISRLQAMNTLMVIQLDRKSIDSIGGMSPDDILARAFCVMTMTEDTEFMFKRGLQRLDKTMVDSVRTVQTSDSQHGF